MLDDDKVFSRILSHYQTEYDVVLTEHERVTFRLVLDAVRDYLHAVIPRQ